MTPPISPIRISQHSTITSEAPVSPFLQQNSQFEPAFGALWRGTSRRGKAGRVATFLASAAALFSLSQAPAGAQETTATTAATAAIAQTAPNGSSAATVLQKDQVKELMDQVEGKTIYKGTIHDDSLDPSKCANNPVLPGDMVQRVRATYAEQLAEFAKSGYLPQAVLDQATRMPITAKDGSTPFKDGTSLTNFITKGTGDADHNGGDGSTDLDQQYEVDFTKLAGMLAQNTTIDSVDVLIPVFHIAGHPENADKAGLDSCDIGDLQAKESVAASLDLPGVETEIVAPDDADPKAMSVNVRYVKLTLSPEAIAAIKANPKVVLTLGHAYSIKDLDPEKDYPGDDPTRQYNSTLAGVSFVLVVPSAPKPPQIVPPTTEPPVTAPPAQLERLDASNSESGNSSGDPYTTKVDGKTYWVDPQNADTCYQIASVNGYPIATFLDTQENRYRGVCLPTSGILAAVGQGVTLFNGDGTSTKLEPGTFQTDEGPALVIGDDGELQSIQFPVTGENVVNGMVQFDIIADGNGAFHLGYSGTVNCSEDAEDATKEQVAAIQDTLNKNCTVQQLVQIASIFHNDNPFVMETGKTKHGERYTLFSTGTQLSEEMKGLMHLLATAYQQNAVAYEAPIEVQIGDAAVATADEAIAETPAGQAAAAASVGSADPVAATLGSVVDGSHEQQSFRSNAGSSDGSTVTSGGKQDSGKSGFGFPDALRQLGLVPASELRQNRKGRRYLAKKGFDITG